MDIAVRLEEVVESILRHLRMRDLHSSARVCKMWSKVVSRLKVNRQQLSWLLFNKDDSCDTSEQIINRIQLYDSEPKTALLFCSSGLYENTTVHLSYDQTSSGPAAKKRCESLDVNLSRLLPRSCKLISVITDGIIGTTYSGKLEELEDSQAASCLLLPDMSGVDVYSFIYTNDDDSQHGSGGEEDDDSLSDQYDVPAVTGIPEDASVKLILWFTSDTYDGLAAMDLALKLEQHYPGCVVAGADAGGCKISPERDEAVDAIGIAFCGENVQVASVYIPSDVKKMADITKCLQKLKNCNMNEKKSIAFMLACVGRGKHFYRGKKNVESSIFNKLFPNTPLFGLFGNGEIGYDYLPDFSQNRDLNSSNLKSVKSIFDLHHSDSTIFVLLCFP